MASTGPGGNAIKLVGEALIPGASNLVDGNIPAGAGHLLLGAVAGAVLGPLGLFLVKANSFSFSVSDKHLHNHIGELFTGTPDPVQPGGTQPGGTQPGGTQPGGTQPGGDKK